MARVYNSLLVKIFQRYSTTERYDPLGELATAAVEHFGTFFLGGRYGAASILIPRADVTSSYFWRGGDRLEIKNGLELVYEGEVGGIAIITDPAGQGLRLDCTGSWGALLGRRYIDKRWADNRLSEFKPTTNFEVNKFNFADKLDRLKVIPLDGVVYANGDKIELGFYQMPTGHTVKRITFDYAMSELGLWKPGSAKHNNDPVGADTYTELTNALDDDTSTSVTVTITLDDYIYVGTNYIMDGSMLLKVDMGATVNAVAATLACQYSQGGAAWASQTITDGTASAGKTLAQDGNITFTTNKAWAKETVDSKTLYWLRFQPSANLTASINIVELDWGQSQAWKLALWNNTSAADEWSVTATGSGSQDITLGTADDNPGFYFVSQANQVGIGNGSIYGQISNIVVYGETGSITPTEVVKDVRALASEINSDETYIDSNTLTITPFFTAGFESYQSILARAAGYGDASFNSWRCYLLPSTDAASPNGEPLLALEQYPDLDDYDLVVRVGEENLAQPLNLYLDNENIWNWIIVKFRNILNDDDEYRTPDDDANLKDTTSITAYGERHYVLDIGSADATTAISAGRRFLAYHKDPRYFVGGPITVVAYIRKKDGSELPSSAIYAGLRLRVEDYLIDPAGTSTGGAIFLITETSYEDAGETCQITVGIPDVMDAYLASALADSGVIGPAQPPLRI